MNKDMKDEDFDKELQRVRKKMNKLRKEHTEGMPSDNEFEKWADQAEAALNKVSAEMVTKMPESIKKQGFAEAFFVVLARFTCRLINRMQQKGMFAEGTDGFGFYSRVLLPACNDIVMREAEWMDKGKDKEARVMKDIWNLKMPIDDILKKHFPDREDDWPEIREALQSGREIAERMHKDEN